MNPRIYLDNNAGTLVDPHIISILTHHLKTVPGNPSSIHSYGREAKSILSKARQTVSDYLNVKQSELIFTSSGTEALNMVLRGLFIDYSGKHIISSSVEHSAVYSTLKHLESKGCKVTYLNPGIWGAIQQEQIKEAIEPNTSAIVLMAVNNETGVKTELDLIAQMAKERRIPLLVDAIAWLGKESVVIPEGVSAMCFSGYKFHAPKGIGCAYVRSALKLLPMITGGDQEYGKRGGTENLIGIVGFSEAVQLLKNDLPQATQQMTQLRDKLEHELMKNIDGVYINGEGPRICNTTNLSFEGIEGETLLTKLDLAGIAASHGAACSSGALEPSRILLNMGLKRERAYSSIRFSLCRFTTEEEIDKTIDIVIKLVSGLRA